jgi:hypothetical protein
MSGTTPVPTPSPAATICWHGTQTVKPVTRVADATLDRSTGEVLDGFLGNPTTVIAAVRTDAQDPESALRPCCATPVSWGAGGATYSAKR